MQEDARYVEEKLRRNFVMNNSDLVLLNKLTYSLSSVPSVHSKIFMTEIFFEIIDHLNQCY